MTLPETAATLTPIDSPLMVNTHQAAKFLGIGRDSTYKLVREGKLKAIRIGNRAYIPRAELETFVKNILEQGAK